MKIFISWAKPKSKKIASLIREFLEGLFHDQIEAWISDEKKKTGDRPTVAISKALKEWYKGIFCN